MEDLSDKTHMLVLDFTDGDGENIISATNVNPGLISIETKYNFLHIKLFEYEQDASGLSGSKKMYRHIIIPSDKTNRIDLVDLDSSLCPEEYLELYLQERSSNGE